MMTKMSIDELQCLWADVKSKGDGYILLPGEFKLDFHVGYSYDHHMSFVILNTGKIRNLFSSQAIVVECINRGNNSFALQFTLQDDQLDEIFVKLCWDLANSSLKATGTPIENLLLQYKKWQKLLQLRYDETMSFPQQKGLLGELLYLNEKMDVQEQKIAIDSWVGPEGADQDFMFDTSWSEVKGVSIAATSVQISSLEQLDCKVDGELHIFFMDKTTSQNAKISLPVMVSLIADKIVDENLRNVYYCKLAMCGYLIKDVDKYNKTFYKISEHRAYLVNAEFPKLTKKVVPLGIVRAKYNVDLVAIEKNRIRKD